MASLAKPLMNRIDTAIISNPHLRGLILSLRDRAEHTPETAQLSQDGNTILAGSPRKDSPRYNDTYQDSDRHIDHTHEGDWGDTHQDYSDYSDHGDYCD